MDISQEHQFAARLIKAIAQRMVGTAGLLADDVPDLQQDLWLELLTRLPKYRADRGSPRGTWLNGRRVDQELLAGPTIMWLGDARGGTPISLEPGVDAVEVPVTDPAPSPLASSASRPSASMN